MSMLINRRDLEFQLYEMLDVEGLCTLPRFAQHDRATFDAIIDSAYQLAEDKFASHAARLDANEPQMIKQDDFNRVELIPEVGESLAAYIESGFMGMAFDEAHGGLQLPYTVSQAIGSIFSAANVSTAGYPFLTAAAANLLRVVGSEEQQARYMHPMIEGRFFGTMCLSEPQAGSSLGDIRTRAVEQADGSYRIVGNKMWISGGEHDLAENIVHMVLARIEGAPAGTRGISLFIVPKYLVNEDGSPGERNGVRLAGLNHKMGYRGTVNTVLNFGEKDDCTGYLVGEPNKGLAGMFHMMNEARIGVGLGATVLGYTGYLHSLDYARERLQGRPVSDPNPEQKPVAIIEHTDVKRMLLAQKAYVEGALGLCMYCAQLVDQQEASEDETVRKQAALLLEILTPIAKAWPSEWCLEANKHAIQILGGYGYTRDYPVERFYRDNRLNPIHEGTNGIQAMDLLGRKVVRHSGAALKALLGEMAQTAEAAASVQELQGYATGLQETIATIGQTTQGLVASAGDQPERFLANADSYLQMLGHAVIAWQWLRQALRATQAEPAHQADRDFYAGKLAACRYFFNRELPSIELHARLVADNEDSCLNMENAYF